VGLSGHGDTLVLAKAVHVRASNPGIRCRVQARDACRGIYRSRVRPWLFHLTHMICSILRYASSTAQQICIIFSARYHAHSQSQSLPTSLRPSLLWNYVLQLRPRRLAPLLRTLARFGLQFHALANVLLIHNESACIQEENENIATLTSSIISSALPPNSGSMYFGCTLLLVNGDVT
jgi:hypothetical protein